MSHYNRSNRRGATTEVFDDFCLPELLRALYVGLRFMLDTAMKSGTSLAFLRFSGGSRGLLKILVVDILETDARKSLKDVDQYIALNPRTVFQSLINPDRCYERVYGRHTQSSRTERGLLFLGPSATLLTSPYCSRV